MSTCTSTYRTTTRYAHPPEFATIPCERTDADDETGRHKGRHHGWENMPAGERATRVPDPDRPGWTIETTETFGPWRRLWNWDQGGASGSNRRDEDPIPCPVCGTLDYRESAVPHQATLYTGAPDAYSVAGDPDPQACFHCRLWAERIEAHAAGWKPRSKRDRRLSRTIRLRNDDGTASPRLNAWADGVTGAFGDRAFTVLWDDGDQRGPASSMWDSGAIPWWLDDQFPTNAVLVHPVPVNPVPVIYTDLLAGL